MVQTRSAAKRIKLERVRPEEVPQLKATADEPRPDDSISPPVKTRRREDVAGPKKRRREKRELCRLNLDVLFLIAAYIHPIDLLNLARTCKSLRELLMDKSSVFVWKATRQHIEGLPVCPADLTEPEYANLVFCARCHNCGKFTMSIFWNIRRRYCLGCRKTQLRRYSSSPLVIRTNNVLPMEYVMAKKVHEEWVDRGQVASFMSEYRQSSDKAQFISDKEEQCIAIRLHARQCKAWHNLREMERQTDRNERRLERGRRIFNLLEQHGYQREIAYFDSRRIQQFRKSDFRPCKPLTDREWGQMLPEWIKIMNDLRSVRLEETVFRDRRYDLKLAYMTFLISPDTPTFELLPDVTELSRFPPFKDVIKAPEETQVDHHSFASILAQLPVLVSEWREKIDAEVAELMKIPPHLSKNATSSLPAVQGSSRTRARSIKTNSDKLQLACAVFHTSLPGAYTHLEVFATCKVDADIKHQWEDECDRSVSDRFGIQFLEEAPYIVYACGLDPHVAKVDDMDCRNARLICLCCATLPPCLVVNWRHAMWHARTHHQSCELAPLSESPRWQLVGDEHIDAIQAVEQSEEVSSYWYFDYVRCQMCRPHVGDMVEKGDMCSHVSVYHGWQTMERYVHIGICTHRFAINILENGKFRRW